MVSLVAFAYTSIKLGATPIGMVAFLLSPPVIHSLVNANIEWIPLLGFILPPRLGLFFIAVKPQTGFAVVINWLVKSWRVGGYRELFKLFSLVILAYTLSIIIFGLWPAQSISVLDIARDYNASLWPMSIPMGLVLLIFSIRKERKEFAIAASPWLSPYVLFHSWSSSVVALSAYTVEMITAVFGLWVLVAIRYFSG